MKTTWVKNKTFSKKSIRVSAYDQQLRWKFLCSLKLISYFHLCYADDFAFWSLVCDAENTVRQKCTK